MAKQLVLKQQLEQKEALLKDVVQKISAINLSIFKLTQKFIIEAGKIQQKLKPLDHVAIPPISGLTNP